MRLSEAIMLGSVTCKLEPRNINSCGYGCALNAIGEPQVETISLKPLYQMSAKRYYRIIREWPWTKGPCFLNELGESVYRMFDTMVCEGMMTLDQLVDYVRSIEPDCDCNRFNCDCATKQLVALEAAHETSPQASR